MKKLIELLKRLFNCKPSKPKHMEKYLNAGNPFSMTQIQGFVRKFKELVGKNQLSEAFNRVGGVREAEFFGANKLNKLLSKEVVGQEVLGLRIYYGINNGEPRLFLVPVGMDGKEIQFDTSGLKDSPDGDGLGDGLPQPPFNNP